MQAVLALNPRVTKTASLVSTSTTKKSRKYWKRQVDCEGVSDKELVSCMCVYECLCLCVWMGFVIFSRRLLFLRPV